MEKWQLEAAHVNDLEAVAEKIIHLTEDCNIVLLKGELGSGKTTLTKFICKLLNVKDEVSSPTFSLVNQYGLEDGKRVFHFDLYRLKDADEALDIGCDEYFNSKDLCLIEWPEIAEEILPENRIEISIEIQGNKRLFNISKFSNVR